MSKGKKIILILAAVFIGVGVIIVAGALALAGFNITKFNTKDYELKAVEVNGNFKNIDVQDIECDIRLVKSADNICRVEYAATKGIEHNISVHEDTLKVTSVDTRKWYEHIGIFAWEEMKVTVYLPENEYESLSLNTLSGDILVPTEFSFYEAVVSSTSGDVSFTAETNSDLTANSTSGNVSVKNSKDGKVSVKSTSGDVDLSDIKAEELTASSTSGDVNLSSVEAKELMASSTSGDVDLYSVIISGKADIKAVSGDIELDNCDADSLSIKTVSGDVDGKILSTKNFITDTTSGDVRVPASDYSAGECEITTTSGDIEIEVAQ